MGDLPSWARVGAKVVCVEAVVHGNDLTYGWERLPVKDETYTLRQITVAMGTIYVCLKEVENRDAAYLAGHGELLFSLSLFRPLVTEQDDVALFQRIASEVPLLERLDRLKELLDEAAR